MGLEANLSSSEAQEPSLSSNIELAKSIQANALNKIRTIKIGAINWDGDKIVS